jgi:protein involved in polysaccharide export with SLBB domain
VGKPGPYAYRHGYRVGDYLAGAGGMEQKASEKSVKIMRKGPDGEFEEPIHLDLRKGARHPSNDIELQPGDIIVVPTSQVSGLRDVMELLGRASPAFLIYDRLAP